FVFVLGGVAGHNDLLRKLFIRRRDEENLSVESQLSDDGIQRPLLQRYHASLPPPSCISQGDFGFHLIAVHCRVEKSRRYIDIAFDSMNPLLWNHEAVTVPVDDDRAFNEVARSR